MHFFSSEASKIPLSAFFSDFSLTKYIWCIITICLSQDLAVELSNAKYIPTAIANGVISASSPSVPHLVPVYLKLGTWQWALSLGLDDDSIPEILMAFTHCAKDWAKA